MNIYIGTHGQSIYEYKDDELISRIDGIASPTYLLVEEDRIYSVSRNDGASVASFQRTDGGWQKLSQQPTHGGSSCHLCLDETKQFLLVANYSNGSVSLFPVGEDGVIGEMSDYHEHKGYGPNQDRQDAAHAHFVGPAEDKDAFYCVDLGIDKVKYYKLDRQNQKLFPDPAKDIVTPPGTGPRHYLWHEETMYVICELSSEVLVYDANKELVQQISTLPEDWEGENTAAAIKLSPDKQFLYASNRGYDSIAVFRLEADKQEPLSLLQVFPIGAYMPRDFDLTENLLATANQGSDSVSFIDRDPLSGELDQARATIFVEKPTFVQLVND